MPAVSTVLTAFMGGLALGGWWAGRNAHRWARPLEVYGRLELLLAAAAVLVPLLLRGAEPLYAALYPALGESGPALDAVRFAVSAMILLPPTFLMGATLPVLVRHAEAGSAERRRVADLYGINTLGAAGGTLAATFGLLPSAGLTATLAAGVALNVTLGIAAIALGRKSPAAGDISAVASRDADLPAAASPTGASPDADTPAAASPEAAAPVAALPFPRPLLYLAAGVLGFAALAFEVLWTRALALSLGTTIYAFAVVLAVFLLGIAAGSLTARRLAGGGPSAARAFALCPVLIGAFSLALLPLFDRLPALFVTLAARGGGTWGESVLVQFLLAGIPLLPPTFVSGAALPLAVALDRRAAGHRATGDVYAANTLGAILGSWAAGFVILPAAGLQSGVTLVAALPVLASLAIVTVWRGPGRVFVVASALTLAVAATANAARMPEWNRSVMPRGAFVLGADLRRAGGEALAPENAEIVFLEEGLTSTVTVRREDESYTMQLNGVTEASTAGDLSTQVSVAGLPLLLHGHARDVLVIGLGGGITAATAARFPGVESIDVVEISPEVVRAARAWFGEANGRVLEDPRVRLLVGDGRSHVRLSRREYDVVVSLPSHVWNSGIGSLMSAEFYAEARERLRPGGILCSWIQGYSLSTEALRSVVAAVRGTFPAVQVWRGAWGDLLIVAGDESFELDVSALVERQRLPGVAPVMQTADAPDAPSLLSLLLLSGTSLDSWIGGSAANTDDRPTLEFEAPKLLYADSMGELFEGLHRAATAAPIPATAPAEVALALGEWRRARSFESAGRLALRAGEGEPALRALEDAYRLMPAPSIRRTLAGSLNERGAALARRGDTAGAARSWVRALQVGQLAETYLDLGRLYRDSGQLTTALAITEEGLALHPDSADLHALRAGALVGVRRIEEARDAAMRALELRPRHLDAHAALADALDRLGEKARADSVLTAGLELHPGAEELEARRRKLRGR
ncbi:MAG: fused MFS/spermidine synthase [Candidatus Eiseniibacteriota bacterium]